MFEGKEKKGPGRPKVGSVPVSTRLPRDVLERYKASAIKEGKSLTSVLAEALEDYLIKKEIAQMSQERLYYHPKLPQAFAAFYQGELYYWFANVNGWEEKKKSVWNLDELIPLPSHYAVRTAWPGIRAVESKLYQHHKYKHILVAVSQDKFWYFPQERGGWDKRGESVYRPEELIEIDPAFAKGTGWPGTV